MYFARWLILLAFIPVLSEAGSLAVVVTGKVTTWEDGTPIPADKTVYIRLYGAKQGIAKTFLDSAPTADRLKFRRPDTTSTAISCYEVAAWVDQNGDGLVQPEEEGVHTAEACGRFTDPVVIKKPASPTLVAIEAPAQ